MVQTLARPQSISGMTWERFKLLQQAFEGLPNVRLGY